MSELSNIERLQNTLNEYANTEVPDNLDPWPAMQNKLSKITSFQGDAESATLSTGSMSTREGVTRRVMRPSLAMFLVLMVGIAVVGFGIVASNRTGEPVDGKGYEFVPVGMVRHIVTSSVENILDTNTQQVEDTFTSTQEVWFRHGHDDYLMRLYLPQSDGSAPDNKADAWVQDQVMYSIVPNEKVVYWQAWPFPFMFAPDPDLIKEELQNPGARVISDTVSDGRSVIVIESDDGPYTKREVWVDKGTNRLFQLKSTSVNMINTTYVTLDELVDANTLAPDFFDFKLPEGYTLQEYIIPTPPMQIPDR